MHEPTRTSGLSMLAQCILSLFYLHSDINPRHDSGPCYMKISCQKFLVTWGRRNSKTEETAILEWIYPESLTILHSNCMTLTSPGIGHWLGGICKGNGTPTPVLLPGKYHGWRSLVGCSPWGCRESDTTEWLHFHFSLSCIGEGNGNPL